MLPATEITTALPQTQLLQLQSTQQQLQLGLRVTATGLPAAPQQAAARRQAGQQPGHAGHQAPGVAILHQVVEATQRLRPAMNTMPAAHPPHTPRGESQGPGASVPMVPPACRLQVLPGEKRPRTSSNTAQPARQSRRPDAPPVPLEGSEPVLEWAQASLRRRSRRGRPKPQPTHHTPAGAAGTGPADPPVPVFSEYQREVLRNQQRSHQHRQNQPRERERRQQRLALETLLQGLLEQRQQRQTRALHQQQAEQTQTLRERFHEQRMQQRRLRVQQGIHIVADNQDSPAPPPVQDLAEDGKGKQPSAPRPGPVPVPVPVSKHSCKDPDASDGSDDSDHGSRRKRAKPHVKQTPAAAAPHYPVGHGAVRRSPSASSAQNRHGPASTDAADGRGGSLPSDMNMHGPDDPVMSPSQPAARQPPVLAATTAQQRTAQVASPTGQLGTSCAARPTQNNSTVCDTSEPLVAAAAGASGTAGAAVPPRKHSHTVHRCPRAMSHVTLGRRFHKGEHLPFAQPANPSPPALTQHTPAPARVQQHTAAPAQPRVPLAPAVRVIPVVRVRARPEGYGERRAEWVSAQALSLTASHPASLDPSHELSAAEGRRFEHQRAPTSLVTSGAGPHTAVSHAHPHPPHAEGSSRGQPLSGSGPPVLRLQLGAVTVPPVFAAAAAAAAPAAVAAALTVCNHTGASLAGTANMEGRPSVAEAAAADAPSAVPPTAGPSPSAGLKPGRHRRSGAHNVSWELLDATHMDDDDMAAADILGSLAASEPHSKSRGAAAAAAAVTAAAAAAATSEGGFVSESAEASLTAIFAHRKLQNRSGLLPSQAQLTTGTQPSQGEPVRVQEQQAAAAWHLNHNHGALSNLGGVGTASIAAAVWDVTTQQGSCTAGAVGNAGAAATAVQGVPVRRALPRNRTQAATRTCAAAGAVTQQLAGAEAGNVTGGGERRQRSVDADAARLADKLARQRVSTPQYRSLLARVRHQVARLKYEQRLLEVAGQDGQRAG
ncbi:MAG: hypothetical protein WDW36_001540 [Sanguina aurantia]